MPDRLLKQDVSQPRKEQRARELAETKYSYEAYLARTREAIAHLNAGTPEIAGGMA